ncbi:MAG: glycosyltransferase family 4 protein [Candidatus Paceibacterota bacterium]
MKVLMISTDRNIFKKESAVHSRILEYGSLVKDLQVIVFTKKSLGFKKEKIGENITIYPTNSSGRFSYIIDAMRIGKYTKGIDLVTTQDPFETALVGKSIADAVGAKLHIQIHTDFLSPYFTKGSFLNKARVFITKIVLPHADGLRVVSNRILRSLQTANYKLRAKPVVLPIFVDVKKIEKYQPVFNLHAKYSQFETIILMASRLTPEKNISLGLEVMKSIVKKYPKTGLIIVGDGHELSRLKLQTVDDKLQTNIVFEEWTDDILSYYKTADIFLQTSNYEGYGMALVEATFAGLPVVTTDVGIADELKVEKGAWVCDVGDKACLTASLSEAIKSKEKRETRAHQAQKTLEKIIPSSELTYLKKLKESWEQCLPV